MCVPSGVIRYGFLDPEIRKLSTKKLRENMARDLARKDEIAREIERLTQELKSLEESLALWRAALGPRT